MGRRKSLKIKGLKYLPSLRNHSSGQVHVNGREACLLLTEAKPPSVLIQAKSYLPLLAKPHQFLLVFLCYSSRTLPLSIFCLNSGKNLVF